MSTSSILPIPYGTAETDSIKIGPEFFQNAIRDYSNKYWAFVREIFQNSMDSEGCNRIDVEVKLMEDGTTRVAVADNGAGMTEDVLRNKLLTLGGSGKGFQNGKVGGFGKAKEILYFAQNRYSIRTNNLKVEGSGAQFKLTRLSNQANFRKGCLSMVHWDGDVAEALVDQFRYFCFHAQWPGRVFVNGIERETSLRKGRHRRDLGYADVYTNRTYQNRVVVRMRGIPMFYRYCGYDHTVVLELIGDSAHVLTSNRDYLTGDFGQRFQNFLTELTVDKSSALRNPDTSYVVYEGNKISVGGSKFSVSESAALLAAKASVEPADEKPVRELGIRETVEINTKESINQVGIEFIIKNSTNPRLTVPAVFEPGSERFSKASLCVAEYWIKCLIELHVLFDSNKQFSVGFVFDGDTEAQYQKDEQRGEIFFINPAKIVRSGKSRRFKNKFKKRDWPRILSLATHEFVHSEGHSLHDENYSSRLTEVFAKVLENQRLFRLR